MSKTRLVYVLPTYDANSQEHLYHIYGFLQAVARQAEVWLIIERAKGTPSFPGIRVHRRRLQIPVLRAIEVGVVMLLARLHGYRVFYSHYSVSGAILSALVTRLLGGESFYWNCVHTLDFVPARPKTWSDWKLKLRNQYLLGLALHLVHHLVTGTPTMARYYSNGYNLNLSSVRVMPNWVDLKRFENLPEKAALRAELGWPTHQQIILFLHRVVERKGAHYIVPIAREILARSVGQPSPLVVVAGSGPYEARLLAEIRAAGLGDVVRQVGGIPNRDAIRYFAAADVYMVPSTEEGFPRTLLEA
ncbi:MAG TPA: glycosyltransferase family 4 protein, partial [Anaerolineae bacterium]|nr:glycosyltransferase family 4 protein [Anaerolineae bacterium]